MPTLWEVFRRSLSTNSNRPALAVGESTWTYRDVAAATVDRRNSLIAAGVTRGDRVLMLMGNEVGFPVTDLAIMSIGAVKIPLNAMLTATEIGRIAQRTTPRVAVVGDDLRPLAERLPSECAVLESATIGPGAPLGPLPDANDVSPSDLAVVYFTGGTTGEPKGVVHTQDNVVANLLAHLLESGIDRDDRLLLTTPLPHAAGLFTLAALLRGAFVRIDPGFDADAVMRRIEEDRTTWTFAVPTMIYRLLDAADRSGWRPESIRTVQYGAAPIAPERLRHAIDVFGPVFQQLYAQTECPNYATVLRKEDHIRALDEPHLLASCGKASIMCDVAVLDEAGEPVPAGSTGEVAVAAPYVMNGLWHDDGSYAKRFSGRWLLTGDVGRLDDEGFLYLVDRRNDMIVSGGMNVYSVEVERALQAHPAVAEVAVIGVPHDDWGEAVHAVVVPSSSAGEPSKLEAHCREHLAAYKRPKSFEFVESLPLTRYGKIDKKALREPHWAGRDRSVG